MKNNAISLMPTTEIEHVTCTINLTPIVNAALKELARKFPEVGHQATYIDLLRLASQAAFDVAKQLVDYMQSENMVYEFEANRVVETGVADQTQHIVIAEGWKIKDEVVTGGEKT